MLLLVACHIVTVLGESYNDYNSSRVHHRRLQARQTLSPEAKATVMLAHEFAVQKAKEKGNFVYEKKEGPFQVTQSIVQRTKISQTRPTSAELESSFVKSLEAMQDSAAYKWNEMDPLSLQESGVTQINALPRLELPPLQVEYLGVTVDAARYYFPIPWWKRLIPYLHKMHYNLIHLRLTDDENFVIQLESYPSLAYSTGASGGIVYTPNELEELVALAKRYNITIVPEVNLPLQAASWSGIPGLIVDCPKFICDVAHYVPLNIDHKDFQTILHGVLQEVLSIFDRPPMLHFGGSISQHDADGCFEEAGRSTMRSSVQYLEHFESLLSSVLRALNYTEDQVIRMQSVDSMEPMRRDNFATVRRVGGIQHYWMSLPGETETRLENFTHSLVSTGVEFAADHSLNALAAFQNTQKILKLVPKPKGIVVGTHFLGSEMWLQQNILARMIAVAMGTADGLRNLDSEASFFQSYKDNCKSLLTGKSQPLCDLRGHPTDTHHAYLETKMKESAMWRRSLCDRLTVSNNERIFQPYVPNQKYARTLGNEFFWKTFHRPPNPHQPAQQKEPGSVQLSDEVKKYKHSVEKTGIILDFANSLPQMSELKDLIRDFIAPLGLDLLQLRLSDDFGFAAQIDNSPNLANSEWENNVSDQSKKAKDGAMSLKIIDRVRTIPTASDLRGLVDTARVDWGMSVFPEISISSNAGGWINGGFLVHCPNLYCSEGTGIPNDIRDSQFLVLVYSVLRELREVFGSSSYIHLGSDERVENLKCYEEAGLRPDEDPPFGVFEKKLKKMLHMLGINPNNIIRWNNDEELSYDDRVGDITHYRSPIDLENLPDIREGEPFLMTADILSGSIYRVYTISKALAKSKPLGIMGEIRSLEPDVWKKQHIGLRLIAFALGISYRHEADENALSHEMFVKKAVKLCKEIHFPMYENDPDCKQVVEILQNEKERTGDDDAAVDGEEGDVFPIATDVFRDTLCQKHTRPRKTKVMRKEFMAAA